MVPKDILILILGIWECYPYAAKKNFAYMVELRILGWGDYPGLCGWVLNEIISVLKERQKEI